MYIAFAILFALLAIGGAYAMVRYVLQPAPDFSYKKLLVVGTVLAPIIGVLLLVLCALLPSKMEQGMQKGIQTFELYLNSISPDYCNQVLEKEQLRRVLSDSRSLRTYLDENADVNFIVKAVGVNAYISYMESFANGIDNHLTAFEATEQPFTIHNILAYIDVQSREPILKATVWIEVAVFILILLYFGFIYFFYLSEQKGWFKESSVTFGENI